MSKNEEVIPIAQQFKKRDKHVQKITRDGLVERNLATGEENSISQRGQDFSLQQRTDEMPLDMKPAARKRMRRTRPAETDGLISNKPTCSRRNSGDGGAKSTRLSQFKRLADNEGRQSEPTSKFTVENGLTPKGEHIRSRFQIEKAGVDIALGAAHKKLSETEEDNLGVESAHKTELAVEGAVRTALRFKRRGKYRTGAVGESPVKPSAEQTVTASANKKRPVKKPILQSNPVSRLIQKQKIKRKYAAAARGAKRAVETVQAAESIVAKAAKSAVGFFKKHPMIAVAAVPMLLFLFFFSGMFASCSNIGGSGFSSIIMSSYLAEDKDIDDAELVYSEWETGLQLEINNAERDHPGYDAYRYQVDDISHNPHELMAYLTARYQDFTYSSVEAELMRIFNEQYNLEFIEEVEIRYRTETRTDSETGESYDVQVAYEWYILNINLTANSFTDIITASMSANELEMYGLYMQTRGNRQYITSPFDFDWIPYISEYYGWRVSPSTGQKDYHKGVDISVPAGTDVLAGQDGRMATVAYDAGGYGWYAVIDDGKGLESKYANCDTVLVSEGQEVRRGDVIAKSGNSGIHLEVVKDGQYLNPIYFAESPYGSTQPPGSNGYPGAPMDDATFAALMEEAMKHLGKPYVFGASGPDKFDCSGFVSYVLNHSGIADVGRKSAQGLYNSSTPVSKENAQPGDLIFFEGTRSASVTVTHVAIYIGNGMMIHAGKPVQYASINTAYWQTHFYSFGRI